MTADAVRRGSLRRQRLAVSVTFLLYGTILGAWTSRIPAIRTGLGLSDGRLSLALLTFAGGAVAGMQLSGRPVDRYGSRRIVIWAAAADGMLLIPPAYAPSLVILALSLFAFGAVHGTLNVAMNSNAIEVQRAYGKPIMSSFHAVYSIGGFVGAAAGGLSARAGLGPAGTFAAVCLSAFGAVACIVWWSSGTAAARAPASADSRRLAESASPASASAGAAASAAASAGGRSALAGVAFLGVLAFCCLVGEGAAADWSAVYLRVNLGASAAFAATAFAAFSIAMTAGRLVGDRLTVAIGPVRLVQGCAVLASAGLGVGLAIGRPIAGVIGFGCLGAGLSCIVPQVFSAAGMRHPDRSGQAVARVASLGFLGFVLGPVLIGGASGLVGLRWALSVPVVLVLFVALAATAIQPVREPASA